MTVETERRWSVQFPKGLHYPTVILILPLGITFSTMAFRRVQNGKHDAAQQNFRETAKDRLADLEQFPIGLMVADLRGRATEGR